MTCLAPDTQYLLNLGMIPNLLRQNPKLATPHQICLPRYALQPFGWDNDPEQEVFKFSALDYLFPCVYVSYTTFFRVDDNADKPRVTQVLKQALEKTLSQVRHFCGVIEKEPGDASGHAFVKNRDSSVDFIVQYLDEAEDEAPYPSFLEIEKSGFVSRGLGDLDIWSVAPMTCECRFYDGVGCGTLTGAKSRRRKAGSNARQPSQGDSLQSWICARRTRLHDAPS